MLPQAIARYQTVQINTGSPGEILIALFDGMFKFLNAARLELGPNGNRARAGQNISRAYAIIAELLATLEPRYAPELCANLAAIYDFCLSHLTEGNRQRDPKKIEEVIRVMTPIREAFTIAVKTTSAEAAKPAAAAPAMGAVQVSIR